MYYRLQERSLPAQSLAELFHIDTAHRHIVTDAERAGRSGRLAGRHAARRRPDRRLRAGIAGNRFPGGQNVLDLACGNKRAIANAIVLTRLEVVQVILAALFGDVNVDPLAAEGDCVLGDDAVQHVIHAHRTAADQLI